MNIQVMYHNNKTGEIDAALLEQMISINRIKMFMRSDGWAMVGISHTRGRGGAYAGPERREMTSMIDPADYRIVT